jgi:hypothetical protein
MIAAAIRLRAQSFPSENAIMSKPVTPGVIVGNRGADFGHSRHPEARRPPKAAQFRSSSALRIPNSELVPHSAFRIPH